MPQQSAPYSAYFHQPRTPFPREKPLARITTVTGFTSSDG